MFRVAVLRVLVGRLLCLSLCTCVAVLLGVAAVYNVCCLLSCHIGPLVGPHVGPQPTRTAARTVTTGRAVCLNFPQRPIQVLGVRVDPTQVETK